MYHCETFGFSGFRAKETMIQESTTGILATDETRMEHGKRGGEDGARQEPRPTGPTDGHHTD